MPTNLPTLRQGDQGLAVSLLQRLLIIYGYEQYLKPDGVSGSFGAATAKAVKIFQDDHFLNKDGTVGDYTWEAMVHPFETPKRSRNPVD